MTRSLFFGAILLLAGVGPTTVAHAQAAPPGYVVVEGSFINGSGIGTARSGMTVASCAAACDAEPRCLSFEMYTGGTCGLNAANRSTRPNILSRSASYTYYEKRQGAAARPASSEQLFIYQNCSGGPTRCTLGVADGSYATRGNARHREGWRQIVGEGPFSSQPAAWRRLCRLHNPPSRTAPDITSGRVDCAELGVTPRGSGGRRGSTRTPSGGGRGGAPAGYVVVEGAFINGSGIGRARPDQTVASCAAACNTEPRCLSFEMYTGGLCGLNAANRSTRPNILSRSTSYRYFERTRPPGR